MIQPHKWWNHRCVISLSNSRLCVFTRLDTHRDTHWNFTFYSSPPFIHSQRIIVWSRLQPLFVFVRWSYSISKVSLIPLWSLHITKTSTYMDSYTETLTLVGSLVGARRTQTESIFNTVFPLAHVLSQVGIKEILLSLTKALWHQRWAGTLYK